MLCHNAQAYIVQWAVLYSDLDSRCFLIEEVPEWKGSGFAILCFISAQFRISSDMLYSLFVYMSHNCLHVLHGQSRINMSVSNQRLLEKEHRCGTSTTKSQRRTVYILLTWLEKCWYIIVAITHLLQQPPFKQAHFKFIYRQTEHRFVVSGCRCCFPTIKLHISGILVSFSKIPGGLNWDRGDSFCLAFSLCFRHYICDSLLALTT